MGWLYNRLVLTYSVPPEMLEKISAGTTWAPTPGAVFETEEMTNNADERTSLLAPALASEINTHVRDFMSMYVKLVQSCVNLLTAEN